MSTLFSDTFTDANGTALSSHTGESGVTYTRHEDFSVATITIQSNQAAKDTDTNTALYYASVESPRGFVEIECVITDKSEVNRSTGICITDSTTDTGVIFRRQNATTWQLLKIIDGTPSASLLTADATFSAEAQHTLKLRRLPETDDYECVLDGTVLGVVTISDPEIRALRKIGIRATNTQGAVAGYHVDSLSARTLTASRALFRGRNFLLFEDTEVNQFEFWPVVVAGEEFERSVAVDAVASVATAAQFFSVLERSATVSATATAATAAQSFSVVERAVAVAGTGSIAAVGLRIIERGTALGSTANVVTTGERIVERAASLDASTTITSSAESFTLFERAAVIETVSAVESSAVSFSVFERSASLSSAAAISSDGFRLVERAASVTTTVTVQATSESFSVLERTAEVASTGTLTASAHSIRERQAGMSATATVAVSRQLELSRQSSLSAAGTVSVTGGIVGGVFEHERSAELGASGTVTSAGSSFSVVSRSARVEASATVTTDSLTVRERQSSLSAIATPTVTHFYYGPPGVERAVSINASATITVNYVIHRPPPPSRTFMVSSGERTAAVRRELREFKPGPDSRELMVQ